MQQCRVMKERNLCRQRDLCRKRCREKTKSVKSSVRKTESGIYEAEERVQASRVFQREN